MGGNPFTARFKIVKLVQLVNSRVMPKTFLIIPAGKKIMTTRSTIWIKKPIAVVRPLNGVKVLPVIMLKWVSRTATEKMLVTTFTHMGQSLTKLMLQSAIGPSAQSDAQICSA